MKDPSKQLRVILSRSQMAAIFAVGIPIHELTIKSKLLKKLKIGKVIILIVTKVSLWHRVFRWLEIGTRGQSSFS
jgi:hypothetical protein